MVARFTAVYRDAPDRQDGPRCGAVARTIDATAVVYLPVTMARAECVFSGLAVLPRSGSHGRNDAGSGRRDTYQHTCRHPAPPPLHGGPAWLQGRSLPDVGIDANHHRTHRQIPNVSIPGQAQPPRRVRTRAHGCGSAGAVELPLRRTTDSVCRGHRLSRRRGGEAVPLGGRVATCADAQRVEDWIRDSTDHPVCR